MPLGRRLAAGFVLSGGNRWTPGEPTPDSPALDAVKAYLGDVAEVWKGYGDAIIDTVSGLWNAAQHPISTAKGVARGAAQIVKDPVGALKAIGKQIADDFTSGDPRKAGKLVGQVLIALAGAELSPQKLATLLPKVEAAAAGEAVNLTAEEAEAVSNVLKGELSPAPAEQGLKKAARPARLDAADATGTKHIPRIGGRPRLTVSMQEKHIRRALSLRPKVFPIFNLMRLKMSNWMGSPVILKPMRSFPTKLWATPRRLKVMFGTT